MEQLIQKISGVAAAVGFQAGVSSVEIAGLIVSYLAANPEQIDRFLADGTDLFIDGTIRAEHGALSFEAIHGSIVTPAELRARKGSPDQ